MENITYIGWVSEPDRRGTIGILKSCVITLGLCVYTALHLNISRASATAVNMYVRKALWVLIGMLGPELVVFFAWDQRQQTKNLTEQLESIFREQERKDPLSKRQYKWTQMHSFYAIMGGFVVDTNVKGEDPYIPSSPRLALHEDMILDMARLGILPDISKEYIKDKSKADSVAKILAISQASWFILQTIMRWAEMLPVTALELNTIAHAICALVVYVLWWEKPLDIQDPTLVTAEGVHLLTALYWELGSIKYIYNWKNNWKNKKEYFRLLGYDRFCEYNLKETKFLSPATSSKLTHSGEALSKLPESLVGCVKWFAMDVYPDLEVPFHAFRNGEFQQSVVLQLKQREYKSHTLEVTGVTQITDIRTPQNGSLANERATTLRRRWDLIFQLKSLDPEMFKLDSFSASRIEAGIIASQTIDISSALLSSKEELDLPQNLVIFYLNELHTRRKPKYEVTNFSAWTLNFNSSPAGILVFALCSVAYGGVHASAWNDYFPSEAEQLLWRISLIYVAALGIFAAVTLQLSIGLSRAFNADLSTIPVVGRTLGFGFGLIRKLRGLIHRLNPSSYYGKWFREMLYDLQMYLMILIMVSVFLIYCFTRAYLVIEAFISLRQQPTDVYSTPKWPQYLPHL